MSTSNARYATILGMGALGMWTVEPLFISEINTLPIFELLTIIFTSSFLLTSIRLTLTKRWHLVLKQPIFIWVVGFIGICASDFAYIFGAKYAPIAHVDLIDYLWPCFAILFTSLLPNEKLSPKHIIGALFGFAGIYVLINKEVMQNGFNPAYFFGYGLALAGALIWSSYSAFSRHFKAVPTEMIGMYCGVGALVCGLTHLQFETYVMPSTHECSIAVLTGITGAGIAYQLWDYGVKHGEVYLLSMLTYVARIAAMALLVCFGKEPFSWTLVAACCLGSFGVMLSTIDNQTFRRWFKKVVQLFKPLKPLPMDEKRSAPIEDLLQP